MGRLKTISDADVLDVARAVFQHHGHSVSTRAIAEAAGISEAVLYQRYGTKDDLFFAAMHPRGPDIDALLGPPEPTEDARIYLRKVTVRLGRYFAEVIPQALHVMMHPSFDPAVLTRLEIRGSATLERGLAERMDSLIRRKQMGRVSSEAAARMLLSLAHDWALGHVMAHGSPARPGDLRRMVDLAWNGLRTRE